MRLKPKTGYWRTDYYPIGGSFGRAGTDGKPIETILRTFEQYKNVNAEVRFTDGTKGAVNTGNIDLEY